MTNLIDVLAISPLTADTRTQVADDTLDPIYALIGGGCYYVETVYLPGLPGVVLLVDEEGYRNNQPLNAALSRVSVAFGGPDRLVGGGVFVGDGGEDFVSLTAGQREQIHDALTD